MSLRIILIVSTCLYLCLLSSCGARPSSAALSVDQAKLKNGNIVDTYTLKNDFLSVTIIPELGGKITSIKSRLGREFLSNNKRPHVMRRYGMKFNETEFDGIDESFPSLAASQYPVSPWQDRPIPDHGEIYQLPWTVVKSNNKSITLSCRGKGFTYVMERTINIDGLHIYLDYTLTNLSANSFHCNYTFHPLFAAEDGCYLEMPDHINIHLLASTKEFLGEVGSKAQWGSYLDKEGGLFKAKQFTAGKNSSYRFVTQALETGHVRIRYPDQLALAMRWPSSLFPYAFINCSQGEAERNFISAQPSNSSFETLHQAYRNKQSLLLKGNDSKQWRISMTIEEPLPTKDDQPTSAK